MLPLLALVPLATFLPDLEADLQAATLKYAPIEESSQERLTAGDLAGAQKLFLDAVPEAERTAAHWFMLGNMWFDLDPAFSFKMHERATQLAPDEKLFAREWAIELHRAGRWADADAAYLKARSGDADEDASYAALRADCLLRLGRTADACAAWRESSAMVQPQHKLELFAWVHGPVKFDVTRARWLGELAAKQLDHAEDLLLGDIFYTTSGDEYDVRYEYMEHDGQVIGKLLPADDARTLDLNALVDSLFLDWEQSFPDGADSTPRKNLLDHAQQRKWIGDGARLPAHPRVAHEVIVALLRHAQDPAQLLTWHRAELLRRATKTPADDVALGTLVLLARRAKDPALADYEKRLSPDARELARKALDAARTAKTALVEPLTRAILADFEHRRLELEFVDGAFAELGKLAAAPTPR